MGKIAAIGGGRYSDGEITSFVGIIRSLSDAEKPKMLFLPTAGRDNIDGDEYMLDAFKNSGCETDILFLTDETLSDEYIKSAILGADIIYAGGGDLVFLMTTLKKTKADVYLKQAYEKGTVMSGYSSGSMCWFDSGYDDCGEDHSFVFADCLGILPFCNCPHFESEHWQTFIEAIKTRDQNGVAADDGAMLIYNEGEFSFARGNDGGDVYFFDKNDSHKMTKISDNPNVLKKYF